MRWLSSLLLVCIIFLSAFGGLAKPMVAEKVDCCKNETACHKAPAGQKKSTRDCKEPICNMMFSCQLCGFIVKEAMSIKSAQAHLLPKPATPYIISNLNGYQADSWKPPRNS